MSGALPRPFLLLLTRNSWSWRLPGFNQLKLKKTASVFQRLDARCFPIIRWKSLHSMTLAQRAAASLRQSSLPRNQRRLWDFVRAGLRRWNRARLSFLAVPLVGYGVYRVYSRPATQTACQQVRGEEEEGAEFLQWGPDMLAPAGVTGYDFTLIQHVQLVLRFAYLTVVFLPTVLLYGFGHLLGSGRLVDLACRYTLRALQAAGPAFVKLGQWASTRRDIFSEEFCSTMSGLHTHCDPHHWSDTERLLTENLGEEWERLMEIPNHEPIGSGCVAQVYKGFLLGGSREEEEEEKKDSGGTVKDNSRRLKDLISRWFGSSRPDAVPGGHPTERGRVSIAVKVLHPGVVTAMERDICLMKYVAGWVDYVYPDVHWVSLKECIDEFSTTMRKQLDLKREAANMQRFQDLLYGSPCVRFPTPITPHVTSSVLVESFEEGTLISEFLDNPGGKLQKNLARIGIETLLDMLFVHNFVHGDLHPGNILVSETSPDGPKLVLLDCGIATSLSPFDLKNFKDLFTALVKGDGVLAADLILGAQHCSSKEAYRRSMDKLVRTAIKHLNFHETQMAKLFSSLFNVLIEHKVRINPNYTSIMMALMVIEGLGRSLDPSMDILAIARPYLLQLATSALVFRKQPAVAA